MGAVLSEPSRLDPSVAGPVAYMCAEYGVHASLPIYSGGLGVLAGDTLKEASDRRLPVVAIGLLYRRGYHRQRLDTSGRQLEYWVTNDPKSLPMARISVDGAPLKLSVDVFGRRTWFQVWRVDVGRVPLLLIDSEVPENDHVQRWYTARLYEGERPLRLAQYALLGIGGVRVLRALGIEPGVFHLNEGHPALAALESPRATSRRGPLPRKRSDACASGSSSRPTRRCLPGTRRMGARSCWPPCPTSPPASVSTRRRSSISSGRRRATRARALG